MLPLNVQLFGKFCVRRDKQTVSGLDACKLQELFSYILIFRDSPHSREGLASLIWGDCSTVQSKKYLRQTLWQLQTTLGSRDDDSNEAGALTVDSDWVSFNTDSETTVDVQSFEKTFFALREIRGQNFTAIQAQNLDQAIQLYQGDLLEGWYQDWCLCERERLQSNYLLMLDKMMNYCEAQEKFETGLSYGLRVLRYDRARESTHRRLMRLHYLSGNRTAALRQYDHCVTALNEELGVRPSNRTRTIYEKMRADEFRTSESDAEVALVETTNVLPKVIDHLKQLRWALKEIHGQVQQDIKAVDAVLDNWRS